MSYKKLKERLFNSKIQFERIDDKTLNNLNINRKDIDKNLIQYFIFFEELENKTKLNPDIKIQSYGREIHLIIEYLDTLDELVFNKIKDR